jgi:RNA polymerase sigma factor (sigma-70 family)
LYTIMRNIFINNYRKNKRFTKVSNEAPSDLQQYETGKAAYNEGWNQMRMQEIKKAIDALPKPLQFSFELYYAGYKYQEIADITKEPIGTIKSRIHFARKTLVTQLER